MTTVRQVLQAKGWAVWSISPETTMYEALQLMAEKNVGALVVLDEGRLVGIFTERDYARKVALQGRSCTDTLVREVMTPRVIYVHPDQTVEDCMGVMTKHHIRHLPVLEGGKLVGLISIRDVIEALLAEREFLIEQLESYITSGS
ncbi:MAG: CBS domain-containing protein [Chloroflexi bacterium]|nr:MAG: CBS domain-containing protein [Chloroflexota bacterium]